MNNKHIGIHNSVFRVGIVYSVNGREVKIRVDHNKNSSHLIYKGALIKNVSVGSYVKILKGYTPIIGKVESEYIDESKQEDKVLISAEETINRTLIVKLIGFIDNQTFRRTLDDVCAIVPIDNVIATSYGGLGELPATNGGKIHTISK